MAKQASKSICPQSPRSPKNGGSLSSSTACPISAKSRSPMHPGISAVALSGHKFHGPKGIGLLFPRSFLKLAPLLTGGNQEYHCAPVRKTSPESSAWPKPCKSSRKNKWKSPGNLHDLRLHFENGLKRSLSDIAINGEGPRISNTSNIAFLGIDGETLLMQLDLAGVAALTALPAPRDLTSPHGSSHKWASTRRQPAARSAFLSAG